MALKWGIVGAGKISTQFVKAVSVCSQEEHQVVAVASQNLQRAKDFASELNIAKAYGNYQSLAEDGNVEVIYVGNLNTQHLQVVTLMLQNGKHVLCEKPLTINEKQSRKVIELARNKKLFLMEAVWSRCFPAYEALEKLLATGIIGQVQHVRVSFGRRFPHIDRLASKELGGGTILDLGIYTLQFVQFVYGASEPSTVIADGKLNGEAVDENSCTILAYPDGQMACITTDAIVELANEAVIAGTKGIIKVPRFWCPTTVVTPRETLNFELPQTDVQFKNSYTVGLVYEVEEVRRCIRANLFESPKISHQESLQLARLMDKVRQDVGVTFPEDAM